MRMLHTVMAGPFTFIKTLLYYYYKFTLNTHSRVHYPEASVRRMLKGSVLLVIEVFIHRYFPSGLFHFSPLPSLCGWRRSLVLCNRIHFRTFYFQPNSTLKWLFQIGTVIYTNKSELVTIIQTVVVNFNQQAKSRHIRVLT